MHYSFEDIERQAQKTNSKAHKILGDKVDSWKHKKAAAVLAFSATLVAVSFVAPNLGNFSANLLEKGMINGEVSQQFAANSISEEANPFLADTEDDFVADAQVIDIAPLSNINEEVAEVTEVAQDTVEVNPFLSVVENKAVENIIADIQPIETLHGSAPEIENVVKAVEEKTNKPSPFKTNVHTFDTVSTPLYEGEMKDPLAAPTQETVNTEDESLHGVAEIVTIENSEFVEADNRYTGTLRAGRPPRDGSYPFGFRLELEDGSFMPIQTSRDLRNVIDKKLTIEIEGTKENFVLKHVYFKKQSAKTLPQSGPQSLLIGLIGGCAGLGAWLRRKKK